MRPLSRPFIFPTTRTARPHRATIELIWKGNWMRILLTRFAAVLLVWSSPAHSQQLPVGITLTPWGIGGGIRDKIVANLANDTLTIISIKGPATVHQLTHDQAADIQNAAELVWKSNDIPDGQCAFN